MWGTPPITFVNALVVGPSGKIFRSLRVRGGHIDSLGVAPDRRDTVIDADGSIVLPGLINAHDHLELNSFPRLKWRERYCNVREWIADFQPRFASDPALAAANSHTLDDRLWVGALKNLLSGVTTVCHHNPLHRALRSRYPIRVVREFGYSHSLGIDGDSVADAHQRTPSDWPWIVHAAEGVDAAAGAEVQRLSELGCLEQNTVLVHGVALTAATARQVLQSGGALIWCPTSNDFLFGRTADARQFDDAGRLAIGSDSRLSGEGDLLDELRAAHGTRQVSTESLYRAVTEGAARVLRLASAGQLAPGAPADVCMIRALAPDPFDALAAATRSDVRLTMVGGRPVMWDADLGADFRGTRAGTPAAVDGSAKVLATWIASRAAKLRLEEPGLEIATC